MTEIQKLLFEIKKTQKGRGPEWVKRTMPGDTLIGLVNGSVRKAAKIVFESYDYEKFMKSLPHKYYEEDLLHMILINMFGDYDKTLKACEEFVPYIRTWAVTDIGSPKCFKDNTARLFVQVKKWIKSKECYVRRFGLKMLMDFYLGESFKPEHLELAASACVEPVCKSNGPKDEGRPPEYFDSYFINMMVAWYFATAFAFKWNDAVKELKKNTMNTWTHNKAIQKGIESFRVSDEHKEILRTLKR